MSISMKSNDHVAFYLPSLRGGGAEKVILNLVKEFVNRGFRVDLVLVKAKGEHLDDVPKSANIIDLDSRRFFAALPSLASYLKSNHPDVLLSTIDTANIVAIFAKRIARVDTKIVIRISNVLSTKGNHGQFKHRVVHLIANRVYPYADDVVAVSHGVADDLVSMTRLSPNDIATIYNPSVTRELLAKREETPDHSWFEEDDHPIVLGVGELSKQKDFQTLIRGFSLVVEQRPARLVILGEGPDRKELEILVEDLEIGDVVSMPGFVTNPYSYMANSDVFVLTSKWEGCPNVLIEALACNAPVISTDCPSGPDEILESGKWGTLVPVGDHRKISQEIISILNQDDWIDTEEYAQETFSLENVATKYEKVMDLK